jgi:hypothetical protein
MGSKFISTSDGDFGAVSDGSLDILGASLGSQNLTPGFPIKIDSQRKLYSTALAISDVINLQSKLDTTIQTPYTGTIEATDFKTASVPSSNTAITDLKNKTEKISISGLIPNTTQLEGNLILFETIGDTYPLGQINCGGIQTFDTITANGQVVVQDGPFAPGSISAPKITVTNSFTVADTTVQVPVLKFTVDKISIVSRISHIFATGLLPVTNLVGDIGTTLKRFNNGFFNSLYTTFIIPPIEGVRILGKAYINNRPIMSGGFSMTTEQSVSNTTAQGNLIGPGVGSLTIPANAMVAGSASVSILTGVFDTNGQRDLIIRVFTGPTSQVLLDEFLINVPNIVSSAYQLDTYLRVVSTGTTGSIYITNKFVSNVVNSLTNSLKTINTTVNNTFRVTAQWSVAAPETVIVSFAFNSFNIYQP